jgi:hypothetical protein
VSNLRVSGVSGPDYGDDVETGGLVELILGFEPCESSADEPFLAAMIDSFKGLAVGCRFSGLDFGEHTDRTILRDDIDFTKEVAEASGDDAMAAFFQEIDGSDFTT